MTKDTFMTSGGRCLNDLSNLKYAKNDSVNVVRVGTTVISTARY